MVRSYLLTLKIINSAIFLWIVLVFLNSIFDFNIVITTATDELVILSFFGAIKNVFSYIIYGGGIVIALGCATLFGLINSNMNILIQTFFENYLSKWFQFDSIPSLPEIPDLILSEVQGLFGDLYLFVFQILIVIAIIYAIRAIFKSDPKYNFIAIGSIILMMIIPLMVEGLRKMLLLLTLEFQYLEDMINPLSPTLSNIPLDDFFFFIINPVIVFGIISYIYLEIAFQINYTDTVTKPSLERSDRLEAQLKILARESHYITANIDKIKEEAKKKLEEIEAEQKEGLEVGKFFAKTGARFSYIKEMIERKKLEEEEKKLVTAASKTRRLGRYIDRLFREDPEARDTLTAKSSAPRSRNLLTSTIVNFTYRVVFLIIISFIIIHPQFILERLDLPPAITESVAMYSPEVIIILLFPIIVLFPVLSQLISFVKHRSLIIRLQQEGRIKEILASVGDYVKKEEVEKETTSEEAVAEVA
ncbi:hypothetical protein LCGC14_0629640 [marine sediment metagenome]|uniref:Uncharacterized protein n=1 Tax=marine sediment metagenome TaxID=412755 RepID=A0A0F9TNR9_9ZZZZ